MPIPLDADRDIDRLLLTLDTEITAIASCGIERGTRLELDPVDAPLMHYVMQGRGRLRCARQEVALARGSLAIVPAGAPHSLQGGDRVVRRRRGLANAVAIADGMLRIGPPGGRVSMRTVCGTIRASYGDALGFLDRAETPLRVDSRDAPRMRTLFDPMLEELAAPRLGSRAMAGALLKQALVLVVRSELQHEHGRLDWLWCLHDRRVGRALTRILDAPAEPHSVDTLAAAASMSRSAFTRRFSEVAGISPMELVTLARLNLAARLLVESEMPVAAVARSAGFASRSYFSRSFRRRYGVDPSTFRERGGREHEGWRPLEKMRAVIRGH